MHDLYGADTDVRIARKHSGGIWIESPPIQVIKGNLAITTPEKQLATVNETLCRIVPTNTKKVASI